MNVGKAHHREGEDGGCEKCEGASRIIDVGAYSLVVSPCESTR